MLDLLWRVARHSTEGCREGMIAYEEFIASMLDSQRVAMRTDAVRNSFEKLDRDGDG
jgi:calcium-dependent protein kinase